MAFRGTRIFISAISLACTVLNGVPAAWANGWEHGAIPFEALVEALGFGDTVTRMQAAHSLGARGQREAVPHLLGRLGGPEKDPAVRGEIYRSLGRLGDKRAQAQLVSCIGKESRAELRAVCVAALGHMESDQSLKVILRALSADPEQIVRMRAVDALGQVGNARAVRALVDILDAGNGPMASRAVAALGRTGNPAAAKPLLNHLKRSETGLERLAVVDALARVPGPKSHEPLKKLLAQAETPALRSAITVALGAARDGRAAPTLIRLLDDASPGVRYRALAGLAEIGSPEAAEAVAGLAHGLASRMAAADIETVLSTPDVWLETLRLLEKALRTLTEIAPAAGLQAMLLSAAPKDAGTGSATALAVSESLYKARRRALYGLGYTKSKSAAELLRGPSGVGDPDFRLRAVALRSLGVLGGHDNAHGVAPLLTDDSAEVRWTAAEVLGRIGHGNDADQLLRTLADPVAEVRRQSALALGYLGAGNARPALSRHAKTDPDSRVRAAATYALRLIP